MARPYLLKRRGKYWHLKLAGDSCFHSTGLTRRDDAEAEARRAWKKAQADAEPWARSGPAPSFREYAADFFEQGSPWMTRQKGKDRPCGRATARIRQGQIRKYLLPEWGDTSLDQLNPVQFETWLAGLPLANQTKNHMLYTMKIITKEAHRERVVPFDPLASAEPMGNNWRRRDVFTEDELAKLFPEKWDDLVRIWREARWGVAYSLMEGTGMRVGEVCALRWADVDLEAAIIHIGRAVNASSELGPVKNRRPRAAVMPVPLARLLTHWRTVAPWHDPDDYVIPGVRSGAYVRPRHLSWVWNRAAETAKIEVGDRFLGAHALRHTYETRARHLVSEELLRFMLGHHSRAMSDRYDQAPPVERLKSLLGESRGVIDGLFSPAKPSRRGEPAAN